MVKNKDETKQRLRIFERELSVTLQDVFYREVAAQGKDVTLIYSIWIYTKYLYRLAIAFYAICRETSRAIFSLENKCGTEKLGCDRSWS